MVTAGQYGAVMKANPGYQTDANQPSVGSRWADATNFCGKLTVLEIEAGQIPAGYSYRLPTEAEWEISARAGTSTAYYFGNDPGSLSKFEWFDTGQNGVKPVGLKLPNPWGLFDMLGNNAEWCSDWYGPYPLWEVSDPVGPAEGLARVIRGTYGADPDRADYRCAARNSRSAAEPGPSFRLVLAPTP